MGREDIALRNRPRACPIHTAPNPYQVCKAYPGLLRKESLSPRLPSLLYRVHAILPYSRWNMLRKPSSPTSIQPLRRIVLGRNHKTLALARASVHRLDDINELILARDFEVDLIIIARTEVNLNMLIATALTSAQILFQISTLSSRFLHHPFPPLRSRYTVLTARRTSQCTRHTAHTWR